jgi:prepilin-type N-terminal cleavage/methylation domain-containing protein
MRRSFVPNRRRGFNLIELLMALAITAALLTSTMVALNASFMAYQATTEVASTHTIARLTMNRMLTLIRTGKDFGPYPTNPLESTFQSDVIEFRTPNDQILSLEWVEADEALYVIVTDPDTMLETSYKLMEGVKAQYDPDTGDRIKPFTLQYERGKHLYRATIDLTVQPDDNMSVTLDGNNADVIRLVASAMPRLAAY